MIVREFASLEELQKLTKPMTCKKCGNKVLDKQDGMWHCPLCGNYQS